MYSYIRDKIVLSYDYADTLNIVPVEWLDSRSSEHISTILSAISFSILTPTKNKSKSVSLYIY